MGYFSRGFRFAGVGATGTIVNLCVLWVLTELFGVHYLLSEVVAVGVAFMWNFNMNILVGNIRGQELSVRRLKTVLKAVTRLTHG